jgi:hypothetical protein
MRSLVRTAIVLVLALGAGIFVGRFSVLQQEAPSAAPATTAAGSVTTPSTGTSTSLPSASVVPTPLPAGAPTTLRDILQIKGDFAQTTSLYVLASSSDQAGIEHLLEEAMTITQASDRGAASDILYSRYAEIDPAAAIDHMMKRPDFDPGWVRTAFHNWARADLNKALARAEQLDERSRMIAATAIVAARDDMPLEQRRALAAKFNVGVPMTGGSPIDVRTPEAAERSWQAALAEQGGEQQQIGRLWQVATAWARQDPERAIEAVMSIENRMQRDQFLQGVVQSWAQKAPRAAVDWVLARPPSGDRTQLLSASLGMLAMTDGPAAMGLVESLAPGERMQAQTIVLHRWSERDPRAALGWVERVENPGVRRQLMSQAASNFAARKPDDAIRWAQSLTGPDAPNVMRMVIGAISNNDPVRAAGLVNNIANEPERSAAAQGVVYSWARKDPQAAFNWVSRFPDGPARSSMYSAVFTIWAQYDMDAATSQVLQLSDTNTRNVSILGLLSNQYLDTDTIDRLFQRIESPEMRRQAAQQIYFRWNETDPRFAERYRAISGTSPLRPSQAPENVFLDSGTVVR